MWWNRPLSEKTVSERSTLGVSPTYTWNTINPIDWWTKFRLREEAWAAHLHYKNSHVFVPSVFRVKVQFFNGMILRTEEKEVSVPCWEILWKQESIWSLHQGPDSSPKHSVARETISFSISRQWVDWSKWENRLGSSRTFGQGQHDFKRLCTLDSFNRSFLFMRFVAKQSFPRMELLTGNLLGIHRDIGV